MDADFLIENNLIKDVEFEYFKNVVLDDTRIFGGSHGQRAGGVSEMVTSANG